MDTLRMCNPQISNQGAERNPERTMAPTEIFNMANLCYAGINPDLMKIFDCYCFRIYRKVHNTCKEREILVGETMLHLDSNAQSLRKYIGHFYDSAAKTDTSFRFELNNVLVHYETRKSLRNWDSLKTEIQRLRDSSTFYQYTTCIKLQYHVSDGGS